ncbi:MAG: capsule assembly Wzi family protein [Bacteroidota bacterium]
MNKPIALLLLLSLPFWALAQHTGVPLGSETYHIMDRLEIKTGLPAPFHSGLKYYLRSDVTNYAIAIDTALVPLSIKDRRDLYYIFKDNNECLQPKTFPTTLTGSGKAYRKVYVDSTNTFYTIEEVESSISSVQSDRYIESKKPLFKHFYKTPANLFELNKEHFYLKINPILNFKMYRSNDDGYLFLNQRGIEVRGGIDDRIFLHFNILESQARFPNYVRDRIARDEAIPGAGFFKVFESRLFDIGQANDFLLSQGYIGFNVSKHVNVQFGHGRNFLGNGYRSVFLSDFGNNYFYLKFNARVWRFHYQTLFTELSATGVGDRGGNPLLPKKYMAAHHLSINVLDNLTIGLYEAVVFNRSNNFELQYLNPVIFYRTVEQALGSADNAFLGVDFKWNLFRRFSLYGQLLLDELKFSELFVERRGWWGNKYAIQLGLKYIDVLGVDHLDAQVEFNLARPYTYAHRDSLAGYSHYDQALAHPLGANFREVVLLSRYQIGKKWLLKGRLIFADYGEDAPGANWGNNILFSYLSRVNDFGNEIGQGVATNTLITGLDLSYQLYHNFFLELNYFYRRQDSQNDDLDRTTSYFGGGVRYNFANRNLDF